MFNFIDNVKTSFHYIFSYLENVHGVNYEIAFKHFNNLYNLFSLYKKIYADKILYFKSKFKKDNNLNSELYNELLDFYYKFIAEYTKILNSELDKNFNIKR